MIVMDPDNIILPQHVMEQVGKLFVHAEIGGRVEYHLAAACYGAAGQIVRSRGNRRPRCIPIDQLDQGGSDKSAKVSGWRIHDNIGRRRGAKDRRPHNSPPPGNNTPETEIAGETSLSVVDIQKPIKNRDGTKAREI
jgi:hypothetical protein